MAIHFLFNVVDDTSEWHPGTVYYYNGDINEIQGVHNTEELKYIQQTFKELYGRNLPSYRWTKKNPVHNRIFGVLQPGSKRDEVLRSIRQIQNDMQVYLKIYGDPTGFEAQMILPVRKEPHRTAEIIAWAQVGQSFTLDKTVTACDIHWGKIKYVGGKLNKAGYTVVAEGIKYDPSKPVSENPPDGDPNYEEITTGWIPIGDITGDVFGVWRRDY